jgi:hypothetical protein
MKNKRKFVGIALIAVSSFTVSVSSVLSTASADPAPTGTEVVTEELCTWYLLGAPSTIALVPEIPGTEYEGDSLEVSASFLEADNAELNVYSSGNVTTGNRTTYGNCTFYSSATRPVVNMEISDGDFTATAATGGLDNTMDFEAAVGNPFVIDQTSTCAAKWTSADLSLTTGTFLGTVMKIADVTTVDDRVTGTGNDRCKADLEIKINIPGGKTPAYAGQTYSWSGPGFTTSLLRRDTSE